MIQQELIAKTIPGISSEEITAHFGLLPERYFVHTDATEITLHISMVNRLLKSISTADSVGSLKPVIDWKDDLNRSLTIVNVVTWDRAGLFYKLAGAFSVAGLSILGAKVISRSDHIAIDTFYVVEPGRGVVQSANAQEIFAKTIVSNLNPKLLFQTLVDASALPADFVRRIAAYKCASGTFRMNVALSELPRFTCLPTRDNAAGSHHSSGIIMAPSLGYMEQAYFDARSSGWS